MLITDILLWLATMSPLTKLEKQRRARLFLSHLIKAASLEQEAKDLREKAARMRKEDPMLARMENLIEREGKPPKRKKTQEDGGTSKVARMETEEMEEGSVQSFRTTSTDITPRPFLHWHEGEGGEKIACQQNPCRFGEKEQESAA